MARLFLVLGALNGALSVALGAFGAHALASRLEPRALEIFETGVRYQSIHALALLACSLLLALAVHTRRSAGVPPPAAPDRPSPSPSGSGSPQDAPHPGPMPGERLLVASGWAFLSGIILFSGALFLLSLAGIGRMGAVAPLGGLSFIAGWLLLAMGGSRLLGAPDGGGLAGGPSDQG